VDWSGVSRTLETHAKNCGRSDRQDGRELSWLLIVPDLQRRRANKRAIGLDVEQFAHCVAPMLHGCGDHEAGACGSPWVTLESDVSPATEPAS
jgi:hypothetical protein